MATKTVAVPDNLCLDRLVLRSLGSSEDRSLIGCGFLGKAPQWDPLEAAHFSYSAVLILRGSGEYRDIEGNIFPLRPGSLFQRFAGVRHSLRIDGPAAWAECWVLLPATIEDAWVRLGFIDRRRPVLDLGIDLAFVRDLKRASDALALATDDQLSHHLVQLQGLLLSMLRPLRRQTAGNDDLDADRACRLLGEAGGADLRVVARELGLPYGLFRKRFRQVMGLSPGAYRLRRRLERAREMLSTGTPVGVVAEHLGYANPFTFTTLFRRHVGVAPSTWRRRQVLPRNG